MKSFNLFCRGKSYEIQAETIEEAASKLRQMNPNCAEPAVYAEYIKNQDKEEERPLKFFTVIWREKEYKIWAKTHKEVLEKARELDSELDAEIRDNPGKNHEIEILYTDPVDGTMLE